MVQPSSDTLVQTGQWLREVRMAVQRKFRPTGRLEDAEPDLDHVQPGEVGWDEMEVDLGRPRQPPILFGFVRLQMVEDRVNLLIRMLGYNVIQEIEELAAPRPGSGRSVLGPWPLLGQHDTVLVPDRW